MSKIIQRHVNEASRCLKGASIAYGGSGGFDVVKDRITNALSDERYYALTDAARIITHQIMLLHQQFEILDIGREVDALNAAYEAIMIEAKSERLESENDDEE